MQPPKLVRAYNFPLHNKYSQSSNSHQLAMENVDHNSSSLDNFSRMMPSSMMVPHSMMVSSCLVKDKQMYQPQSIQVECDGETMKIQILNLKLAEKYHGCYTYNNFPIQFKVLFESLNNFYDFLYSDASQRVRVKDEQLDVMVQILGKVRYFQLPLEKLKLTAEEQLRRDILFLEDELKDKNGQIHAGSQRLNQKEDLLQQKNQIIDALNNILKEKQSENIKLMNRIRHLEKRIQDNQRENSKDIFQKNLLSELHTEKEEGMTPRKKFAFQNSSPDTPEKQLKDSKASTPEMSKMKESLINQKNKSIKQKTGEFGCKFNIKIDENCKYISKFIVDKAVVEKLIGPTYQLYSAESIPKEGRHFFDIKILELKNTNIVVGVISEKNKEEQYSFKKPNCICYNGFDGCIYEEDKKKILNVMPKKGWKIRTVIDLNTSSVEWFMLGQDSINGLIGKAILPASMIKQGPMYAYFELYWEQNKIKLN